MRVQPALVQTLEAKGPQERHSYNEGAWGRLRTKRKLGHPPLPQDGTCVIFLRHSWLRKDKIKDRKQMVKLIESPSVYIYLSKL